MLKLGRSERGEIENPSETRLDEVLQATVLLHRFRDDQVTWLTDPSAVPLLEGNPYLRRLLVSTPGTLEALTTQSFDLVLDLDRDPRIHALADAIEARARIRFDGSRGWSCSALYQAFGEAWSGEEYVLGRRSAAAVEYDLGFNVHEGPGWPTRSWPLENWHRLETLVAGRYTISYHQSIGDLAGYMDWIQSCRLVVTGDGLGLSLALAMKKRVVALAGPTSLREDEMWGRGVVLSPERDLECRPCLASSCAFNARTCLEFIRPGVVAGAVATLLARPAVA